MGENASEGFKSQIVSENQEPPKVKNDPPEDINIQLNPRKDNQETEIMKSPTIIQKATVPMDNKSISSEQEKPMVPSNTPGAEVHTPPAPILPEGNTLEKKSTTESILREQDTPVLQVEQPTCSGITMPTSDNQLPGVLSEVPLEEHDNTKALDTKPQMSDSPVEVCVHPDIESTTLATLNQEEDEQVISLHLGSPSRVETFKISHEISTINYHSLLLQLHQTIDKHKVEMAKKWTSQHNSTSTSTDMLGLLNLKDCELSDVTPLDVVATHIPECFRVTIHAFRSQLLETVRKQEDLLSETTGIVSKMRTLGVDSTKIEEAIEAVKLKNKQMLRNLSFDKKRFLWLAVTDEENRRTEKIKGKQLKNPKTTTTTKSKTTENYLATLPAGYKIPKVAQSSTPKKTEVTELTRKTLKYTPTGSADESWLTSDLTKSKSESKKLSKRKIGEKSTEAVNEPEEEPKPKKTKVHSKGVAKTSQVTVRLCVVKDCLFLQTGETGSNISKHFKTYHDGTTYNPMTTRTTMSKLQYDEASLRWEFFKCEAHEIRKRIRNEDARKEKLAKIAREIRRQPIAKLKEVYSDFLKDIKTETEDETNAQSTLQTLESIANTQGITQ